MHMHPLILTQYWEKRGVWGKKSNVTLGTDLNSCSKIVAVNTLTFRVKGIHLQVLLKNTKSVGKLLSCRA